MGLGERRRQWMWKRKTLFEDKRPVNSSKFQFNRGTADEGPLEILTENSHFYLFISSNADHQVSRNSYMNKIFKQLTRFYE